MNYYLSILLLVLIYMSIWFVVSVIKKRNDVADLAWGLGFITLAWTSSFITSNFHFISLLTNLLVTIWGTRLALHIFNRIKNKPEDYRYAEWRKQWGSYVYIRSYFQIFVLQGLLLYLISLSIMTINNNIYPNTNLYTTVLLVLGVMAWTFGFLFEYISDKQLSSFIKNPSNKGEIMTDGLWRYSRHPNYFGEVTQWWGIWIISLTTQYGLLSIIGPLTITFLILEVSGIPLLEKKMRSQEGFAEYSRKTSVFIPWFPKA